MKKLMFAFTVLFVFGCESGFATEETITRNEACGICKEKKCEKELNVCVDLDLCGRFDVCIEQKQLTCDQCKSEPDLIGGFPTWSDFENCLVSNCSNVCDSVIDSCSN